MTAPRLGSRAAARLLTVLLALVLAGTLLATTPVSATADESASDDPTSAEAEQEAEPAEPAPGPQVTATYRREELEGVDAPIMPAGCFGPARTGIDPFPCPLNKYYKKRPTIILWGDSHAYMYIPALKEAVRKQRVNLVSFVAGSCPPVLITGGKMNACRRSNFVALRTVQTLKRQGKRFKVVIGSNWSGFRRAYRRVFLEDLTGTPSGYDDYTKDVVRLAHEGTPALFDRLGKMGVDVDVVGQAATVPGRRPSCEAGEEPYNCDLPRWRAIPEERRTKSYVDKLQEKIRVRGRSRLVDATPAYCTTTVCHGKVGSIETYFDDLHLSATRTRNLARFFKLSVADMHRKRKR